MPERQSNKRYTPEFKIKVIETMQNQKLSYKETAREFDIPQGDKTVAKWERIYLEEGKEGLYIERRGRKATGRPAKMKKEVEENPYWTTEHKENVKNGQEYFLNSFEHEAKSYLKNQNRLL